ncbi:hypothetical protein ABVF11_00510 [Pediococcus argentinicus]|uniref:hypothetical protein n=1 Tax=Pediococcus argentinicus TaxID=480391 RepID=UPI00338F6DAC
MSLFSILSIFLISSVSLYLLYELVNKLILWIDKIAKDERVPFHKGLQLAVVRITKK